MRMKFAEILERGRFRDGPLGSSPRAHHGAFTMQHPATKAYLMIVAGDGSDWEAIGLPPPVWEHVSVSTKTRCPTWEEMCWVKDLFWENSEAVIQFHPPKSEYVNQHEFCLHLWKPVGVVIPMPPSITVGIAACGKLKEKA